MRTHRLLEALRVTALPAQSELEKGWHKLFSAYASAIPRAVKFYAGESSSIPVAPVEMLRAPWLSLPFENTLIEIQLEVSKEHRELYPDAPGFVTVWCICDRESETDFVCIPVIQEEKDSKLLLPGSFEINTSEAPSTVRRLVSPWAMALGKDDWAAKELHEVSKTLCNFLCALNCSNVYTVDVPAPDKLNKKRLKAGKLPIFEYKVLHVRTGETKTVVRGGHCDRASPRVHLRRGHVRKVSETKIVWVQPCVVGDKSRGVIHKDYAVHAA